MFVRCSKRRNDGKEHPGWSVVENRRLAGRRVVRRHVLQLGELNGVQESSRRKTVELFGQDGAALFPQEHAPAPGGAEEVSRRARAPGANGPAPAAPTGRQRGANGAPAGWAAGDGSNLGLGEFWRGKLTALEAGLATRDWQQARPGARVKLPPQDGETHVLVQSQARTPHRGAPVRVVPGPLPASDAQSAAAPHRRRAHAASRAGAVRGAVQMIEAHPPTSGGREIVMARPTQPEKDLQLLLHQLKLELPGQGPPKIQALK